MSEELDAAIERMQKDLKIGKQAAFLEIKRREKAIKHILALYGYYTWAKEHGYLTGGPVLDTFSYKKVTKLAQSKPYFNKLKILDLDVWDLFDLCNTRLFRKFEKKLLVTMNVRSILFMDKREWKTLLKAKTNLRRCR